jgi:hypothetical protein
MTVLSPSLQRLLERCVPPCASPITAAHLNRHCFCLAVEPHALRDQLARVMATVDPTAELTVAHGQLFSALPVFVPQRTLEHMAEAVRALTAVAATPRYLEAVMAWAPEISQRDPGSPGGVLGFDFHLSEDVPRLIEINTNPGGLLLNALLARAQQACMPELSVPSDGMRAEQSAISALIAEWRAQAQIVPGDIVAIVDDAPEGQFLYPEFVLFKRLLESKGFVASICDPGGLQRVDGAMLLGAQRVGLVYNRLTDFSFFGSNLATLRQAYLDGVVAVSPHPRAHAIWADKRNLSLLGNPDFLAETGVSADARARITAVVPTTLRVTNDNRDALWTDRRSWFFKPAAGYGSRASYRGDKLTRKTWSQMAEHEYVAQALVRPSERHQAGAADPFKVDIRCYAYRGEVILFAARLYQGQTTNFRTPGGGFAPVLTLPDASRPALPTVDRPVDADAGTSR